MRFGYCTQPHSSFSFISSHDPNAYFSICNGPVRLNGQRDVRWTTSQQMSHTPHSPLFVRSLFDPPHHHPAKVHKSTPSWSPKAPRDVSVIIKMALPVPNTSLVMCVCVHLHKNICRNTHATWQSEATPFRT